MSGGGSDHLISKKKQPLSALDLHGKQAHTEKRNGWRERKKKNSHRINLPTDRIHPHRRKVSSIPGSFSELSFKDVPLVDSPVVRVGQVELDDSDEERSMVVGALSTDGVGSHEAPVVVA